MDLELKLLPEENVNQAGSCFRLTLDEYFPGLSFWHLQAKLQKSYSVIDMPMTALLKPCV